MCDLHERARSVPNFSSVSGYEVWAQLIHDLDAALTGEEMRYQSLRTACDDAGLEIKGLWAEREKLLAVVEAARDVSDIEWAEPVYDADGQHTTHAVPERITPPYVRYYERLRDALASLRT